MHKIIGRNISILYRNEKNYADIKLKKYNLNKVQAEVLIFLKHENGANQTKINEFFLFNKATITKIISHLEKYDYVDRVISENDKREKDIYLTDKGRNILPIIKEILNEWEDIIINNIEDEDIEKVKCILAQMVDKITKLKEQE
ncbi:MarR family winged helix-turn-helix transcriptional regulator [Clostridium grantii]|uniref:DNA-binding transcriptional regulator, MarR family n=1 Tax=Clostridium grantii DSM 8605 TaxID=1121316 RepID=A0A1M5S5Q9_9CLOT|nr:MarR family transcriptional regulator [Clostridium grantii]SHH33809.1 DNA-binding transcriptional regulator, MarR family [Clostridium grantii DSM 8605]